MGQPPLIVAVGTALYGSRWQSELARALGVAIRTVQRWAAGDIEPPAGVYGELAPIVEERAAVLRPLLPRLRKAARGS
jgi:transcriptional regulator with XRE-family HTH domain